MEVKQIATILNETICPEIVDGSAIVKEDLSNIVEVGNQVLSATSYDHYVKALVNRIGKTFFLNRTYTGGTPDVLMDSWTYGSVMQRASMNLPDAEESETWSLVDQASYDPNIYYQPKEISVTFFNKKTTYEIPMSFTDRQIRESFNSASEMNAFLEMIYTMITNALKVKNDALVMRTINNMIGETIFDEYGSGSQTTSSKTKAINLLYLYNQETGSALTQAKALKDQAFLRFASYIINLYVDRLGKYSKMFNIKKTDKFVDRKNLHVVTLSDFSKACDSFLQSDTYHNEMVALPRHQDVPYFQGTGTSYAFADVSKVNVKTATGNDVTSTGVICVMFDHYGLGVCNKDPRVTTNYNPKAEFYTNWYKIDTEYFCDLSYPFVVFFVA